MFRLATFTLLFFFLLIQMNGQQPVSGSSGIYLDQGLIPGIPPSPFSQDFLPVIIKFAQLPDKTAHQKLIDSGIILERYAGKNTYLALIHFDIKHRLADFDILDVKDWLLKPWLKPIDPFQGHSAFTISFFAYYDTVISDIFTSTGFKIIENDTLNHQLTLELDYDDYLQVIEHPLVYAVEKVETVFQTEDDRSRAFIRSNLLNQNLSSGLQLDGSGISIVIGDDGQVGPHIDFQNRTFQEDVSTGADGIHGDQIAGILAGAGNLDPTVAGIVPGAALYITDHFEAVKKALIFQEHHGVTITCTSLADGCNRGYTTLSMIADAQVNEHPEIIHVFSAGNAGEQDCDYGAGAGWGNITGGVKLAKNGIVVGNVTPDDQLVNTSSKGPANDGRIKPDLVANGSNQVATMPDNSYALTGGTSAAVPGVAGVIAQLNQAYRQLHPGSESPSGLIKAALLNTAEDLGNPGPDFSFGWGRVNAMSAFETIKFEHYWEGIVENEGIKNFVINVPNGVSKLNIMLYWHDAPALPINTVALVNDLDLLVKSPWGEENLPWLLNTTPDPDLLQLPAVKGADHLNNVEQVTLNFPTPGSYVISISGYAIPMGAQDFYLVYELQHTGLELTYPAGGEYFVPGETQRIYWDTYGNDNNDIKIEYSMDAGANWIELATVVTGIGYYDWAIPDNMSSGKGIIRISDNIYNAQCQNNFNIMPVPPGLDIIKVCPDHLILSWHSVPGATAYQLYQLGEKYMEPVLLTTDTLERINITDPTAEQWFAVQALGINGLKSRRSIAVKSDGTIFNCIPDADLGVLSIASPAMKLVQNCFNGPISVNINVKNYGINYIPFFPVFYQLDDLPVIGQIYTSGLPPGVVTNIEFSTSLPVLDIGGHTLKVWTFLSEDEAVYNDTLRFDFNVIDAEIYNAPFIETFDQFSISQDLLNCNQSYPLYKGWLNSINGQNDQHDWKVINGESNVVFPHQGQNSNLSSGAYLNISTGVSCPATYGELITPCFDLTGTSYPYLNFWYLLNGNEDNLMLVDLYDGEQWYTLQYFSGITNGWQNARIPLEGFNQHTVIVRFRANPGNSGAGISLDNFSIIDSLYSPIAGFTLDKLVTCSGENIYFKDNSYNQPVSWSWQFSPQNYIFEAGTNEHSKDPVIRFTQPGIYSASLTVTNLVGENTVAFDSLIHIFNGLTLPVTNDFETVNTDWQIMNPDNDITWSPSVVAGSRGELSSVVYIDNHSYNAPGQEDIVFSPVLDLTNADKPILQFDLAYVTFNDQNFERFQVLLSDNCGSSFDHIIFDRSGNNLATATAQNYAWAPRKVTDWTTHRIDLSPFTGKNILLKFVNINGFGNNLYLDNIFIDEESHFPLSQINLSANAICIGEAITFDHDLIENWEGETFWYFGDAAIPAVSTSNEPLLVHYDQTGIYKAYLILYNGTLHSIYQTEIQVLPQPVAAFDFTIDNNNLTFINLSTDATTFQWEFSNGAASIQVNPEFLFDENPIEWATLHALNECGEDEITLTVSSNGIMLPENSMFGLYPNPTSAICYLNFKGMPVGMRSFLSLINATGQCIYEQTVITSGTPVKLDLSTFPAGIYYVNLTLAEKNGYIKVVKF